MIVDLCDRNQEQIIYLYNKNTCGSLEKLEKAVETLPCQLMFLQHFSFSQNSTCISVTQWKHGTCFIFLIKQFMEDELTWLLLEVIESLLQLHPHPLPKQFHTF